MKKAVKIILIVLLILIIAAVAYVAYVLLSYYRIGDVEIDVEKNPGSLSEVTTDKTYKAMSYNIGFGAYQQDYTCVLDSGEVPDGNGGWKQIHGTNFKALSAEDAVRNTDGAADTVASKDPDFAFIQEIDQKSDRTWHLDQTDVFKEKLPERSSAYALNFHTPFLTYPLNDMVGRIKSGIMTLSRYDIKHADRYGFTVNENFFTRVFELDRCFTASYIDVDNGKQLVLVNLHMSAYDEGGTIRNQQRAQLYSFIQSEYDKGNYVIAGGDFNHDMLTNNPDFPEYDSAHVAFADKVQEKTPDYLVFFFDDNKEAGLPDAFHVVTADNCPTCRGAAMEWKPGYTYCMALDAFIVSDNVEVKNVANIMTSTDAMDGFAYSDHDPVLMEFELK